MRACKMNRTVLYIFCLFYCLSCFISCTFLFKPKEEKEGLEPVYKTEIVWRIPADIRIFPESIIYEGNALYFLGATVVIGMDPEFYMTKINLDTAEIEWKSEQLASGVATPVMTDTFICVFDQNKGVIQCVDKITGNIQAKVHVNKETGYGFGSTAYVYEEYIYLGLPEEEFNFWRIDTRLIDLTKPHEVQEAVIEKLFRLSYRIYTIPIAQDDILYCMDWNQDAPMTPDGYPDEDVQGTLVAMDTNTKQIVWQATKNAYHAPHRAFFLEKGILYVLDSFFSAYNAQTGAVLFSSPSTQKGISFGPSKYATSEYTIYNNKLYFTNDDSDLIADWNGISPDLVRNIFCLDLKTGKMLWSAFPPKSVSLGTNPIAANGKVYIPDALYGIRVYNADTGKLLGVDTRFDGACPEGTNVLYKDIMIFPRRIPNGDGELVAIRVGN